MIDGSDGAAFLASTHGSLGCIYCHGGQSGENTKDDAHTGLIADPSDGSNNSCLEASCHGAKASYTNAIHYTQAAYYALFEKRSGQKISDNPAYMAGFDSACGGCHVSCGDCHISSPKPVGGGLVKAHRFNRTPDMSLNCTACHGSRIGDEYYGNNDYAGADYHRVPLAMTCMDCHDGADMHGDGSSPQSRYEAPGLAKCTDCHGPSTDANWNNIYHTTHLSQFACQVCHSQNYKSCNGCHAGEGITGSSYETFKIGYNPRSDIRSEKYVVLRHVPVVDDTYAAWGVSTLPNFSSEPTWKLSTPHNIRRRTDRTPDPSVTGGSCLDACHNSYLGAKDFFLRASDLSALPVVEQQANQALVVPDGAPNSSW